MSKTFNLYCDESTHLPNDRQPYMLLGYISIAYPQVKLAKKQIRAIMSKYNHEDELKWTNVHTATFPMYKELIEYFFMTTDLQFRALIIDKSQIDRSRPDYSREEFYFKMYYQLLHHKLDTRNRYNLYLDIKDNCSHYKLHRLEDILTNSTAIGACQFIRSHESLLLQLADVLLGAINYHLRIQRGLLEGRVLAKRRLIAEIQKHEHLKLDQQTPKEYDKLNRFFIKLK